MPLINTQVLAQLLDVLHEIPRRVLLQIRRPTKTRRGIGHRAAETGPRRALTAWTSRIRAGLRARSAIPERDIGES